MIVQFLSVLLAQDAVTATESDRMIAVAPAEATVNDLAVRVSSPAGVLWEGTLRVGQNQGASYSQNLSQASRYICPPNSPYDRSERSSISFNVYVQNYGDAGMSYQIDASWGRPTPEPTCKATGTRTVQVNKTISLQPGETAVVEGDAGLKVEVTRKR